MQTSRCAYCNIEGPHVAPGGWLMVCSPACLKAIAAKHAGDIPAPRFTEHPLRWYGGALGVEGVAHAPGPDGEKFSPYVFAIENTPTGRRLNMTDTTSAQVWPGVSINFNDPRYGVDDIKTFAELCRRDLIDWPKLTHEQMIVGESEAMDRLSASYRQPTACYFHHVFPLTADASTVCQCGRLTKGFYEQSTRQRSKP